jgi:hypothetical protein
VVVLPHPLAFLARERERELHVARFRADQYV